ncbi:MAG TPA: CAP domain-containing protein [Rhizomicrobium sp.]
MRFAAALLFLGLCALPCRAAGPADFAGRILAVHNAERAALKLPPLVWNETLAAHAAVWARHMAETGKPRHSPKDQRKGEGENLWVGTAGSFSPEGMVGGWVKEKQFFRNGTFPDVSTPGEGHVVGHYTQMIWKNTSKVGCAKVSGGGWDMLVCRYSPEGNLIGEKPY